MAMRSWGYYSRKRAYFWLILDFRVLNSTLKALPLTRETNCSFTLIPVPGSRRLMLRPQGAAVPNEG
jgi:hypothetical protein